MSDMFTAFVNDQLICSAEDELQKSTKTLYWRVILDEELLL